MEFKPHAYQAHCIRKIEEIPKLGLFLDMGLGKTVTTLTAVKDLKYNRFEVRKVLVIAPKKVAEGTWTKEKDKWDHTKMLRVSQVLGSQTKRSRRTCISSTGKMWCGWWIITGMLGRSTWWSWMRAAASRAIRQNGLKRLQVSDHISAVWWS